MRVCSCCLLHICNPKSTQVSTVCSVDEVYGRQEAPADLVDSLRHASRILHPDDPGEITSVGDAALARFGGSSVGDAPYTYVEDLCLPFNSSAKFSAMAVRFADQTGVTMYFQGAPTVIKGLCQASEANPFSDMCHAFTAMPFHDEHMRSMRCLAIARLTLSETQALSHNPPHIDGPVMTRI